jgi:hypothetical protein
MPALSRLFFSSAFASADRTSLASGLAKPLDERSRIARASSTPLPRISFATSLAFCGLTR